MAIATITNWLKSVNKNYAAGNELYQQYGTNASLKVLLNRGNSDYHFNRLVDALEALNENAVEAIQTAKPSAIPSLASMPVRSVSHSLTDTEWAKAPDGIKDLYTENKKLDGRADLLHHKIVIAESAPARLEMALQLLDDRDQTNRNWDTIKDFHATGKLAEEVKAAAEPAIDEMVVPELMKLSKNLPTYISKDSKKLKSMGDGPRKNKVMQRLQANEIKLKLVLERLASAV
ncbi:hypothetical protein [Mucilaginibacter sp.]|uniref:hypothetical protein n=1 Tax=Mucilaginibacter sp. TaxID=1882438 RepID=UPI0035BC0E3F